jgi:hypothetical protein
MNFSTLVPLEERENHFVILLQEARGVIGHGE